MKKQFAKVLLSLLVALTALTPKASAQTAEVKLNVTAGAVAIFNPSMEIGFNRHSAITFDYVGVFAKSDYLGTGYPFMLTMGNWGYRYYMLNEDHNGLFAGLEFGLHSFRMNKNIVPLVINDKGDSYDVGYGYLFGVNFGYKYPISNHFSIEASVSAGWQISMHEGYDTNGVRLYELNPSAEWLAYRGGIYLSYKF